MASVKKRPDGKWRARYRDDQDKEHARHFARKTDAQAWLDDVTASIVTGMYVDPNAGKITFSKYFEQWAERQLWVTGTERAMRLAADSVEFADKQLKAILRSDVEAWVKGMTSRGLAAGTVHTRFGNVHAVLRAAVRDRLIARDPADGVALPRLARGETAMRLPLVSEVKLLLDAAVPDFRPMLALACFAGLRVGEICGLQLGDIDFLGRTIEVKRQVQREVGGGVEVRAPKYNSARKLYVPAQLTEVLSAHVARKKIKGDDAWMFLGREGNPAHQNTVTYYWQRTRAKADVSDIRMHDCRHFFASGLIAEGCDVVTVQRALGHAKATTTLNVYSHLWPTAEDRTRKAAGALFTAVVDSAADSVRTSTPASGGE